MNDKSGLDRRDLQLLNQVARGPGNYPTPSPERVERLVRAGVVKRTRRGLALTLKGRTVRRLARLGLIRRKS